MVLSLDSHTLPEDLGQLLIRGAWALLRAYVHLSGWGQDLKISNPPFPSPLFYPSIPPNLPHYFANFFPQSLPLCPDIRLVKLRGWGCFFFPAEKSIQLLNSKPAFKTTSVSPGHSLGQSPHSQRQSISQETLEWNGYFWNNMTMDFKQTSKRCLKPQVSVYKHYQ